MMESRRASGAEISPAPLAGVNVVELSHWMAGPLAGGVLADWGADVTKIEPPGGDPMRHIFASLGARGDAPNGGWIIANRGKKSIELDLNRDDHSQVLSRLLKDADVFLTNLRPDALKRQGFGPDEMKQSYPRLVYCSVTAYGWGGPDQDQPGYDVAAFFSRTGIMHEITTAGAAPAALMQGIGDSFTAMTAVTGTLAALLERERTGEGGFVEASLIRTGMWALGSELGVQAMGGNPRPPYPREECRTPMYNSYRTSDGKWFFLVGVQARRHLPSVLNAIGRPDLLTDPRFESARAMTRNRGEIIPLLDAAFGAKPLDHWRAEFTEHDVWWAPVQTPEDVMEDRQADAIGAWLQVPRSSGGDQVRSVEAPIRFNMQTRGDAPPPPDLSHDSKDVLSSLGYSADEIASLLAAPKNTPE